MVLKVLAKAIKNKLLGLTSSGRLSMIFDMSMYLRASRALLSSTLSYCSKAWKWRYGI
jgi:hypothetical protein